MPLIVRFLDPAKKQLGKLDRPVQLQVVRALEGLAKSENPQSRCKPLLGGLGGYFSYRIQDLRAVIDFAIEDGELLVIRVGWRKDVYD